LHFNRPFSFDYGLNIFFPVGYASQWKNRGTLGGLIHPSSFKRVTIGSPPQATGNSRTPNLLRNINPIPSIRNIKIILIPESPKYLSILDII
jgi:hypothetical protein